MLTVRVKRPIWIFVGRGVGERRRRLLRGERERERDFVRVLPRDFRPSLDGVRRLVSFSSFTFSRLRLFSFSALTPFALDSLSRLFLVLVERERRFGRERL